LFNSIYIIIPSYNLDFPSGTIINKKFKKFVLLIIANNTRSFDITYYFCVKIIKSYILLLFILLIYLLFILLLFMLLIIILFILLFIIVIYIYIIT